MEQRLARPALGPARADEKQVRAHRDEAIWWHAGEQSLDGHRSAGDQRQADRRSPRSANRAGRHIRSDVEVFIKCLGREEATPKNRSRDCERTN